MYGSQQSIKELTSRYNWLWKQIVGFVISHYEKVFTTVFEKQAKTRLSLKAPFKIKFLLPFTRSKKVLEKIPGLFLGHSLTIIK